MRRTWRVELRQPPQYRYRYRIIHSDRRGVSGLKPRCWRLVPNMEGIGSPGLGAAVSIHTVPVLLGTRRLWYDSNKGAAVCQCAFRMSGLANSGCERRESGAEGSGWEGVDCQ
jgi:hypothetical protein